MFLGPGAPGWGAANCADHDSASCSCLLGPGPKGVNQSLDEMEFSRSACAAAQAGDVAKLARILERSPEAVHSDGGKGSSGYTPLHYAARAGRAEAVQLLLRKGAVVDACTKEGRATSLHRAAAMGHAHIVELLLKAGANGLLQDADGETALHKAAAQGHAAACKLLLASHPEAAGLLDRRGKTPAQRAENNAAAGVFL